MTAYTEEAVRTTMSRERITSLAYGRAVSVTARFLPADELRPYLPHWWSDTDAETEHDVEIFGTDEAYEVIRDLEFWVAEHARDVAFIHAGVVAVDDVALLLPGRSFAGKSELTAALVRGGARYGSDEYGVLTPDGRVSAYPRPLMLRGPNGTERVSPGELGATTFEGSLEVGFVADLRFDATVGWSVDLMTSGEAVLHLIDNAVAAQSRPTDVFETAIATTASLRTAVRGTRGDATEAARELLSMVASSGAR